MKILVATKNPAKLGEMLRFLGDGFELTTLSADAPVVQESGTTFEENAILKASAYSQWSGMPTIADDGGLEIDALGGEPGVRSRRWPGHEATDRELIDLALKKLEGVPHERRSARLRTAGAFVDGYRTLLATGGIDGYIVQESVGDCEPGYPFRSIFWVPRFGKLYRDLTPSEHDTVNHRRDVYHRLAHGILSGASS